MNFKKTYIRNNSKVTEHIFNKIVAHLEQQGVIARDQSKYKNFHENTAIAIGKSLTWFFTDVKDTAFAREDYTELFWDTIDDAKIGSHLINFKTSIKSKI